jgi:deoxyribonuclease-4
MLLGKHVGKTSCLDDFKAKTLSKAIEFNMDVFNLNCAMVFTHGPRGYAASKIDYKKVEELSKNINIYSHSSYPTVGIWNVNEENLSDAKSVSVLNHIQDQIDAIKKCGGLGLVVHISRQPVDVVAAVVNIIKPMFVESGITLLLEMIASKAHPELTYETPEKINRLVNKIGVHDWYGICVDTAHLYSSGFDCTTSASMQEWLDAVEHKNMIKMFHVNGSQASFARGKDQHAVPMASDDNIWGKVKDITRTGLLPLVKFSLQHEVPMILEINDGTAEETHEVLNNMRVIHN